MLQIVVSSENSALEDLCQTYPISSCLAGQTTACLVPCPYTFPKWAQTQFIRWMKRDNMAHNNITSASAVKRLTDAGPYNPACRLVSLFTASGEENATFDLALKLGRKAASLGETVLSGTAGCAICNVQ